MVNDFARLSTASNDSFGNFVMKIITFVTWCQKNGHDPLISDDFFRHDRDRILVPTIPCQPGRPGEIIEGQYAVDGFFHFDPQHVKNLQRFIQPTQQLKNAIEDAFTKVKNCKGSLHIRRGSSCSDSQHFGNIPFASQEAVDSMIEECRKINGQIFVASDSPSTKKYVCQKLGNDKVVTFDWDIGFTTGPGSFDTKLNSYVEWFLLSRCPPVYITMGGVVGRNVPPGTTEGFTSTFGYTASLFGGRIPIYVFNDGHVHFPVPTRNITNRYCWSELPLPRVNSS